ncbi:MAG: LysM peptidoglycan-binding domain-containing protein [Bacteroidales bacterium]|nr:LysM peptidoglycan-binding domain-containing protein [Bacteroidales bacterium]
MRKIQLIIVFAFTTAQMPVTLLAQEISKSERVEFIDGKSYYMHIIEQGQTLYSLSKAYDVPVDELIFENPDAANTLSIGQILQIPVNSREQKITEDLRKDEFRYIFHIVKKGQTLYGISQIYGVEVNDLKRANPDWDEGLKAGQYVKIPMKDPQTDAEKDIARSASDADTHIVKAGETLYSISRKYMVGIPALKAANKELGNSLSVGQRILIPHEKVDDEPEVDEPRFFEHKVAVKETLYGIAKKYRTSIDSIKAMNPGLTVDIFPGEIIRIPASVNPNNYITHRVVEKTRLRKIASKYALNVSTVKDANPDLSNRVFPGEILKVPVGPPPKDALADTKQIVNEADEKTPEPEISDSVLCYLNKSYGDREFKIALMIPLYTEDARKLKSDKGGNIPDPGTFKPFNFVQFYEGFMMGLDQAHTGNLNMKVYVYDVDEKVSKTIQVLQRPELKSVDLIIGPFFSRNFKLVSNFAEMFDITIVNPLTRRTEVLSNPNVIKIKPSRDAQTAMLAKFVERYHPESRVILVRNNTFQYSTEIEAIKARLENVMPYGVNIANKRLYEIISEYTKADNSLASETLFSSMTIEERLISKKRLENALTDSTFFTNRIAEVVYVADSVDGIIRNASIARNNLVVVLSNNEIFVPEILTRLNDLKDTFDITVVGMPEWELLENLETDYLIDLDVHFFTDSYYNFDDERVNRFIEGFMDRYKTYPDRFAFEAYDLAHYFAGAFSSFGPDCKSCLQYYRAGLLKSNIMIAPAYPAGYENLYWNFCRYRNYRIYKFPDSDFYSEN